MNMSPADAYRKDAEGAGKFVLDVMKRSRKWVAKGQGTHEAWERLVGWCARWAFHWGAKSLEAADGR